jgi:hypothetical protein
MVWQPLSFVNVSDAPTSHVFTQLGTISTPAAFSVV